MTYEFNKIVHTGLDDSTIVNRMTYEHVENNSTVSNLVQYCLGSVY